MSKPIACECGHVKSSHTNHGCTFSQCSCKKFFTGISKTTKEIASKISARQILQTNRIDPKRMIEHFKNQKSKSNKIEKFEINKIETKNGNWDELEKIREKISDLFNNKWRTDEQDDELLFLLNKAIEMQPKEWNAWVMKGIIFKNREDYKSAKICFETALIFDKKNNTILEELTRLLSGSMEMYSESDQYIEEMLKIDPDNVTALNFKAWNLLHDEENLKENAREALEIFEKIGKIEPDNLLRYQNESWLLGMLDRNEDTIEVIEMGLKRFPKDNTLLRNLGIALWNVKRFDDYEQCWLTINKLNPNDLSALFNLGKVNEYQKEYASAIEYYKKAMEIDADWGGWELQFRIGYCYSQDDQEYQGLHYYKIAEAKCEPGEGQALFNNIGLALSNMDKEEEAIEYYHKSLAIAETSNTLKNLGSLYLDQGKFQEAVEYMTSAVKMEKESRKNGEPSYDWSIDWFLYQIARCYHELHEYEKALENVSEAIQIEEDIINTANEQKQEVEDIEKSSLSDYLRLKGNILEKMDKDDYAIDCFENANQTFEQAENYYELAEIHRVKKERLKEAVKNYELSFNLEQDYSCLLASSRGLRYFKNRDAELDKWIEEKATEMIEKCDKILEKEDLTLSNFSASQIWSALSYCDYVLGNKEKRIHSATVAATRNEDDLDLWQEKADAEFDLEKYQDAFYSITKAMEIDPNDEQNFWVMGKALRKLGNYELALIWFDRLVEAGLRDGEITKVVNDNYEKFILNDDTISEDAAECFGYRGDCLYETKKSKEALDSINFALELEKDQYKLQQLHNLKGMVSRSLAAEFKEMNSGDFNGNDYKFYFEESKKHYEEAIKLMPEIDDKETMYIFNLAKLFKEFGYFEKSIEQLEIAHQIDEYDREIIFGLIRISIELGDHERERKYRDKYDNLDKE